MSDLDLHSLLREEDWCIASRYIGSLYRPPDLVIAPEGTPYLYRWHLIPRNYQANIYFHVQVDDDPDRPLHDHPWDSQSVILAGGYWETINECPSDPFIMQAYRVLRKKGDVVHRKSTTAHRITLPEGVPYTITQFTTGPKVRDWGFWHPSRGFINASDTITTDANGQSVIKEGAFNG